MIDTYVLKIDKNIEKEDFNRLLRYISEEKRKQIYKFHRFEDAQRCLLGEVLARYAICKRLNIRNSNLIFEINKYGKPMLHKSYRTHFNISHSGNWVVCAVDDKHIGIDVEEIKPIDLKIAKEFFSKDEYLSLINQSEDVQLRYFYMIWTLKESYIKALGMGLSIPLESFTIKIQDGNIQVYDDGLIMDYFLHQSLLDNNNVYAICASNNEFREKIYINIDFITSSEVDVVMI